MPVLIEEQREEKSELVHVKQWSPRGRIAHLAVAAVTSVLVSALIAVVFKNSIAIITSHFLFISLIAAISVAMHRTGYIIERFDAGLVIALIVFEPLGRLITHREPVSAPTMLALPLLLVSLLLWPRRVVGKPLPARVSQIRGSSCLTNPPLPHPRGFLLLRG
jgi:hypothetical protein